jgi:hypothetical protein
MKFAGIEHMRQLRSANFGSSESPLDSALFAFPGVETMPDLICGALGLLMRHEPPGMNGREMRGIRAIVARYAKSAARKRRELLIVAAPTIAMQLRSMKRLYIHRGVAGIPLISRREAEAQLVEKALAEAE